MNNDRALRASAAFGSREELTEILRDLAEAVLRDAACWRGTVDTEAMVAAWLEREYPSLPLAGQKKEKRR